MAAVASRLSVLSQFMEAVGVSDYLGCNGLLEFFWAVVASRGVHILK